MATLARLSDVPYEMEVLADDIVNGKPTLGWRGDPRMSLHIGVVAAAANGQHNGKFVCRGQVIGRNLQVWRHCEDGKDRLIISKGLDAVHEIIPSLCKMDPRSPGFEDTHDAVVANNAKVDADRAYDVQQAIGEMTEHLWHLTADSQNGRTTFRGMPGSNPDKQA